LGRVINAQGQPIDGRSALPLADRVNLDPPTLAAVERPRIDAPLSTGIRAIDGLLTCGKGQRMGIFAGSGVGKSIALGMMTRYTAADVNVVALVGERGREVNEFIERDLGPALAKTVVVVATSDEPALARVRAALTATAYQMKYMVKLITKEIIFHLQGIILKEQLLVQDCQNGVELADGD
jgi:flagellar biosynthesis/type III secretory pathway ATPase